VARQFVSYKAHQSGNQKSLVNKEERMRRPKNLFMAVVLTTLALALVGCRSEWVPVESATGSWFTWVTVQHSEVHQEEMFEKDCKSDCIVVPDTCAPVNTGISDLVFFEASEPSETGNTTPYDPLNPTGLPDETLSLLAPTVSVKKDNQLDVSTKFVNVEKCEDNDSNAPDIYPKVCEIWEKTHVYEFSFDTRLRCTVEVTTWTDVQLDEKDIFREGEGEDIRWAEPPVSEDQETSSVFEGRVTFRSGDRDFKATTSDKRQYLNWIRHPEDYELRIGKKGKFDKVRAKK
jgi:hypothetical protein